MSRLIWSPQALLDVQRLFRFLAGKGIDAAKRAIMTVRQAVKFWGINPGSVAPSRTCLTSSESG